MDRTPRGKKIEDRPELKGWKALYCMTCDTFVSFLAPGSASAARCASHPDASRIIHDLDEPCNICVEPSDRARTKIIEEFGIFEPAPGPLEARVSKRALEILNTKVKWKIVF